MAEKEYQGFLTNIQENGDRDILLPITDKACVRGMKEVDDHVDSRSNPHGVTAVQVGAVPSSQKGQANGIASLGGDGKVPVEQLDMDKIAKGVLPLFPKWEGGTF